MATVPIDLALNVAVGSSIALASQSTARDYRLLRSPALWALVAFEVLVFLPIGGYLLWEFPAWSLMYLVEPRSLPIPDISLALSYPVVAVAAYIGCRRLVAGGRVWPVLGIFLAGLALVASLVYLGQQQVLVVGSTDEFRNDPAKMREALDSPLSYLVGAACVAFVIGWVATVWRLFVLGRSVRSTVEVEPTIVRKEAAVAPTPKPKSKSKKGRKKSS
ncbi:hypothetical protein ACFL6C_09340 [Myxococcota bacterium]